MAQIIVDGDGETIAAADMRTGRLAVVIVGSRKEEDSQTSTYVQVQMKRRACAQVGICIRSVDVDLPEDISEAALVAQVRRLNADPGILVQLPLPKHINEEKILNEISIEKDVDGFHPLNIGKLAMRGRDPLFLPCTPKGCMELLSRSGITVKGKRAVVIGRSNIVGLPVSLLLLKADATVSIVHSRTPNPESIVREADIVIAAAGQAMMAHLLCRKITTWFIAVHRRPVRTVACISWLPDQRRLDRTRRCCHRRWNCRRRGFCRRVQGSKVAGHLTSVLGGVGPVTGAMSLKKNNGWSQIQCRDVCCNLSFLQG